MSQHHNAGPAPVNPNDAPQPAEADAAATPEREQIPEMRTYEDIARWYVVDKFPNKNLTNAQRAEIIRIAAADMALVSGIEGEAEKIAAFREIGAKIREYGDVLVAQSQPQTGESDPQQQQQDTEEEETSTSIGVVGRINARIAGAYSSFMSRSEQREGETDEAYEKRKKRSRLYKKIGATALAGVVVGGIAYKVLGVEWGSGSGAHGYAGGGDTPPSVTDPDAPVSNEIHNNVAGLNPQEVYDLGTNSRHEQSQWLLENGRVNNDFNNIDVTLTKDETINKLAIQYNRSPNELAAQMYQIQGVEAGNDDVLKQIPEDYRVRDGETMEQYSARVGEFLHADGETKDKFAFLTTEYVRTHYKVEDMPSHYQSAYIDADGNVAWDEEVQSSDPNDKIIKLSATEGIRLPCGQPVKILPEEAPAPVQQYEQSSQPVQQNYVPPQGTGGETPVTPVSPGTPTTPTTPVTPVTPGTPTTPTTPKTPETPLAGKSHDPKDYKHEEGAPKVKIDEPASEPARQEPTPAEVTTQTPGQEVSGSQQGGQASGAETTTQAEQQQQQDTPAAPGAAGAGGTPAGNTDPGNPF